MKKILLSLIIFSLSLLLAPVSTHAEQPTLPPEPAPYLVTLQSDTYATALQAPGITSVEKIHTLGVYRIVAEKTAVTRLTTQEGVAFIEPDQRVFLSLTPAIPMSGFTPNDPLKAAQTYLDIGSFNVAWTKTIGSPVITIAVIDTGVNYFHEDLQGKFWVNSNKEYGRDFVNNDGDPYDDHGHGTAVAGIIAANMNNGIGIAGITNSKIMALKAMDKDGLGDASDVAEAIHYAANNGAKIINLSISLSQPSSILDQAISYAHNKGSLVVAATGNHCQKTNTQQDINTKEDECVDVISYLAKNPLVITVTALGEDERVGSFAHTGDSVDITAPGDRIYSTAWSATNIFNAYGAYRGTSFAAPQISGAAALILSQDPSLSPDQVKKRILGTAVKIPAMAGSDYSPQYGYGRLNASLALAYDKTPPVINASLFVAQNGAYRIAGSIQDDTVNSPVGTIPTSNIKLTQYYVDGGKYLILNQNPTSTLTLDATTAPLSPGEHTIVIEAQDSAGNTATKTLKTSEAIVGKVSSDMRDYNGIVVTQSPYTSISSGQKKAFSIGFKNTGSSVWLRDKVRLGTTNKQDRSSIFADSSWLSNNRIAMREGAVAPGEVAHFEFTVTGPVQEGVFKEYFALVADGVGWFANVGAYWLITSEKPSYHAEFVAQSPYLIIGRGDTAELWVEYKNTGSIPWDAGNVSLGTSNPLDRASTFYNAATDSGWKSNNRIKMSRSVVQPGETVRFSFTIKAPNIPMVYKEYFRPVADGVGWMEDLGLHWVIAVQ